MLRAFLWAVPAYAALLIAALGLRGFDPRLHYLTGKFSFDWMCHYWNVWRHGQFLTGGQPLFHTPALFYPAGLDTLPQFPDLATMLFAGALVPVLGVDGAVLGLAGLVVLGNAIGGFVLAYILTGNRFAAFVCGLLLAFNNYTAWAIDSGNFEYGCWIGICLFFTALERLLHDPRWWRALLAGLALALASYINLPMLVPMLSMTPLVVVGWHAEQRGPVSRSRQRGIALLGAASLAALLVAPTVAVFEHQSRERVISQAFYPKHQFGFVFDYGRDVHLEIGPPLDPRAGSSKVPAAPNPIQPGEYYALILPFALWFLMLASMARFRNSARWLMAGGFLFICTFGPLLAFRFGHWNPGLSFNIPLPYWRVQLTLPLGERFQHWDRLMALVIVGFTAASAFSLAYLTELRKGLLRVVIGTVLLVAVLANLTSWPIRYKEKIPPDPFQEFLAKQESRGALIQVPFDFANVDAFHMLGQTRHGRAMLNGVYPPYFVDDPTKGLMERNQLLREVSELQATMFSGQVFRDMSFHSRGGNADTSQSKSTEDAQALVDAGFAYVLVHRRLPVYIEDIPATELDTEEIEAFLEGALGEPLAASQELVVYQVRGSRPRPERRLPDQEAGEGP